MALLHHADDYEPETCLAPKCIDVAAGWFWMGSDSGQDCEQPVHQVWLNAFSLAETQVTNSQYARFVSATKTAVPLQWDDANFNDPEQPVVAVPWFEAVLYCEWLSRETGSRYRLPSEAEWERAARGLLEHTLFPWGNDAPNTRAGYALRWHNGPERVRQSEPNTIGLFEMCENVHEWCSDWFDPDYYSSSPERNPQGPSSGARKSSRGGSWRHHVKISRCSTRSSIPPEFKYADYGFRVVRDCPDSEPKDSRIPHDRC
jgi:sulfatase modifying factor 1